MGWKPERCQGCPAWTAPGPTVRTGEEVWGEGPRDARVVLLGEAPSDVEVAKNSVFVGPAGKVLAVVCASAGVELRQCYRTNVVKCKVGTPDRATVEFCAKAWLWEELRAVAPTTVVALGETAWSLFSADPRGIMAWRGAIVEVEVPDVPATVATDR